MDSRTLSKKGIDVTSKDGKNVLKMGEAGRISTVALVAKFLFDVTSLRQLFAYRTSSDRLV